MAGKPDFRKEISLAMKGIPKRALCYLMLTSKSEGAIEDLLSFRLHKSLQKYKLTVAREFSVPRGNHTKTNRRGKRKSGKRVDIAILASEGNVPVAAIEITRVAIATKAANLKSWEKDFGLGKVKRDLQSFHRGSINCFGLLVVSESIRRRRAAMGNPNAVKYDLLSSDKEKEELPDVYDKVRRYADKKHLRIRNKGKTNLGVDKWFGATVKLTWWLFSR